MDRYIQGSVSTQAAVHGDNVSFSHLETLSN
ncbi:hypothetical protein NK6_9435 [Bradyrhizobium diazoefficiens]|uniref:Uncharacterized protein n=1 Tax=Bradyrhizobium diazoefficiens TaxID=1355477 RepID=A0A0E4FY99_9BRAD|nr:hypothetical protein NK6_9435 [Bradyrhizobium diazoefficiens]